ncbi:MAG: 23S rRNA (guanosine(2251)-2'-O)-methyltransferase RlmB [Cyanobacteriota bacterium]|nr:23S rRNA (guanosine(2251)-2'-O)-methyltransferase RlmB [Cyanobacteriota bacterium]
MNPRSDRRPDSRGGRGDGRPGARFSRSGPPRWRRPDDDGPAPRDREARGGREGGRRSPRDEGRFRSSGPQRSERRPFAAGERRPFGAAERRPWRGGERRSLGSDGQRSPGPVEGRSMGPGERRPPLRRSSTPFRGDRRPRFGAPPPAPVVAIDAPPEAESFGPTPANDLIWGRHPAQAALESGRPIHRVWCTAEMRFSPRFLQLLREAKASGVLVEEVPWSRLGQLTGGAVHQGIVLQSAAADTLDLATLIEGCRGIGEPPLLMALDGLTDPQNLGAIVRSAEALGAHGLVLPQRRSAGLTGSVAKVAAGALEHLPVARVVNLNRALDALKQEGYRVVGLAGEGTVSLEEADLSGPLVVVTGSEGDGLSMLTRRSCDQLVRIPLRGATPSLNASVATALLLYEVARRGWMRGLTGAAPAPRLVRPALPQQPTAAPMEALTGEPGIKPDPPVGPQPLVVEGAAEAFSGDIVL